jgi:hypothetical protein
MRTRAPDMISAPFRCEALAMAIDLYLAHRQAQAA